MSMTYQTFLAFTFFLRHAFSHEGDEGNEVDAANEGVCSSPSQEGDESDEGHKFIFNIKLANLNRNKEL